ncbi:serine/arginine-rich splicing factor 2-like isoform X2 [Watersipora subatra]|uniref:serine/arginine-rich splicing factor 2-like isoform X2 n=1 Tax=Watersipora subatra TaxID=2589382 RepID=UPI00355C51B6
MSRRPPQIGGMVSLKVDNLTYRTSVEDLKRTFSKFGEIGDVYIPRDAYTMESRGFAFIRFFDRRDAEDAIDSMDGRSYDGRDLRVALAKYGRPEGGRGTGERRGSYYGYDRRRRSRSRSRGRRRSRSRSRSRRRSYSRSKSPRRDRSRSSRRDRSRSRSRSRSDRGSPEPRSRDRGRDRSRSRGRHSQSREKSFSGSPDRKSGGRESASPQGNTRSRSRS